MNNARWRLMGMLLLTNYCRRVQKKLYFDDERFTDLPDEFPKP